MTTAEWMIVGLTIGGAFMAFSAMIAEWGKRSSVRLQNGNTTTSRFDPGRSIVLDRSSLPLIVDGLEALGSPNALKLASCYRATFTEPTDPR